MDQAAAYLRPAWMISQRSIIGDHLAQVYQKQGKTKEAEHMYRLALAAAIGPDSNGAEIRRHYQQMTGKPLVSSMDTHRLPNGTWTITPGEELSRMRTVKIPLHGAPSGTATLALAFSANGVENVAFLTGSDEFRQFADKLKAAKLSMPIPEDNNPVQLVRRAILMCHTDECDLTYLLQDNIPPGVEFQAAF